MHSLGYFKYMVQGGDWGSMIARVMVNDYPESCIAIHVNMLLASPPVVRIAGSLILPYPLLLCFVSCALHPPINSSKWKHKLLLLLKLS